uniref:Uncharacterized protein n=1 Tax=Opuntia streptacantha TaxID=393608 RepID=A0A7C8YR12_OPUST
MDCIWNVMPSPPPGQNDAFYDEEEVHREGSPAKREKLGRDSSESESDPDSVSRDSVSPSRSDLGFEWDSDSGKQLGVISRVRGESWVTRSETDLMIRIGGRG